MKIKSLFLAASLIAGVVAANAQDKITVTMTGGSVITTESEDITNITFTGGETMQINFALEGTQLTPGEPEVPTPEGWVDLGLPSGNLWAECNIGATTPEGYGYYFCWGETTPVIPTTQGQNITDYPAVPTVEETNKDIICNAVTLISPATNEEVNDVVLKPEYDAAVAFYHSASGVCMPTKVDVQELINNCTVEENTANNTFTFTSNINGKTLVVPKAGRYETNGSFKGSQRRMWTSSFNGLNGDTAKGCIADFNGTPAKVNADPYTYRYPVRAIMRVSK